MSDDKETERLLVDVQLWYELHIHGNKWVPPNVREEFSILYDRIEKKLEELNSG